MNVGPRFSFTPPWGVINNGVTYYLKHWNAMPWALFNAVHGPLPRGPEGQMLHQVGEPLNYRAVPYDE